MQNVATINRTCRNHRVVALAKSTSGNRPRMSYEANIATVALEVVLTKGCALAFPADAVLLH
jgi:hypothetical protein